jgi:HemY protein
MAEIEETEHGDEGRVREWMGRAMRAAGDPVWTADGVMSDRWLPVSPNGRLDGYQWRVPLAEIGVTHPVIDAPPPPLPPEPGPVEALAAQPASEPPAMDAAPAPAESQPQKSGVTPKTAATPAAKPTGKPVSRPPAKPVEAVIPSVHAPDDPGPDLGLDADPAPEATSLPGRDIWQRIKELLR